MRCGLVVVAAAFVVATGEAANAPAARTARNLFRDELHRTEAQIDAKIAAAWGQFTGGDAGTQRLLYPVGDDGAYILDTGNNDIRSEGMSYGLMLAVQLDDRAAFDRLWTWANRHMRHHDGPRRGYFAWQCARDGRHLDPGSASDGEEWIAMALFFAAHRWGGGEARIDYATEAQALLRAMREHRRGGGIMALFDRQRKQVVFAPTAEGSVLTDPSYHLPAFYELWAQWDDDAGGRRFWRDAAKTSRTFFRRAAHPVTGLMPEYAHFDGRPFTAVHLGRGKGDFRFDAWRTLGNVALDHAWWRRDPWAVEQSNRVLRFLGRWGEVCPNQFTLAGEPLSTDTSIGLTAMAAVAALAAEPDLGRPFVERLWEAEIPEGRWRYYDGLLYLLGVLQVSGRFQVYSPP
jgi:oligosaccharide reducing-end xylanase